MHRTTMNATIVFYGLKRQRKFRHWTRYVMDGMERRKITAFMRSFNLVAVEWTSRRQRQPVQKILSFCLVVLHLQAVGFHSTMSERRNHFWQCAHFSFFSHAVCLLRYEHTAQFCARISLGNSIFLCSSLQIACYCQHCWMGDARLGWRVGTVCQPAHAPNVPVPRERQTGDEIGLLAWCAWYV